MFRNPIFEGKTAEGKVIYGLWIVPTGTMAIVVDEHGKVSERPMKSITITGPVPKVNKTQVEDASRKEAIKKFAKKQQSDIKTVDAT